MTQRTLSRRAVLTGLIAGSALVSTGLTSNWAVGNAQTRIPARRPEIWLVTVPSNLGLRPPVDGHEPGAWRAPAALLDAGLVERSGAVRVIETARPAYQFDAQSGTRIRNGLTIRRHALMLAETVGSVLAAGNFPLVVGGDCSILLGCLAAARTVAGPVSLLHVDGHSDFFHPGNYDAESRLGSVAGMDLALATGRGESLLTQWPGIDGPLVDDAFVVQIGERNASNPEYGFPEIDETDIRRIFIEEVLRGGGIAETSQRALKPIIDSARKAWLHVDLDVLDGSLMPAVDSPGSPGLNYDQLAELIYRLVLSGHVIGLNATIYDPELDPDRVYAPRIVESLSRGLAPLRVSGPRAFRWSTAMLTEGQ